MFNVYSKFPFISDSQAPDESASSLKAVLAGQVIKLLEVQVIKPLTKDLTIIADNTASCLLSVSDRDYKVGNTLKILRPKMLDSNRITSDPKIKPVVSFKSTQISSVKAKRLGELQAAANAITSSPEVEFLL